MVNIEFLKEPDLQLYQSHSPDAKPGEDQICYVTKTVSDNGVWRDTNFLKEKLPIFILQLIIITAFTRLLILICRKPLHQPSFVAELLAGILISPSTIGGFLDQNIFSISRVLILETVGNLGLAYHLFLLGLEMDLRTISTIGSKPLSIGIAGALFPFTAGALFYYHGIPEFTKDFGMGCLYWGVALSVTGLPVIAEILAKLKLLHSELGRIAMSSALINEVVSWILLMITSAVSSSQNLTYLSLLGAIIFVVIAFFVIRPAILWVVKRTKEGEDYSESTICVILTMVLACGLITEVCGLSAMIGAFVFGLIIPQEVLGHRFLVVLQGFVSDLLMPLYYASIGLRMHPDSVFQGKDDLMLLVQVVLLSFLPKLVSTLAISFCYKTPLREGIALAVLMNTKSLLSVVALTLGRDQTALNAKGYALMMTAILVMTITTSPIMHSLYRPTKRFLPSKHRALQKVKPDAELRILACVHELQTVPGISTLLRISNATRRSPICVFALQLIQLTKHTSALLIVHGPSRTGSQSSRRVDGQTDQMISAFSKLMEENSLLSVYPLTAMSPYATMHEDVSSIAEDKRVTLIILPFHKRQTIHNKMEDMNPAYKDVNDNVLANAPCSVGILVDRGMGTPLAIEEDVEMIHHLAMIYIGGPDDREALAYAWRMAGHSNVTLTVLRFVPGENAVDIDSPDFLENGDGVVSMTMDIENEKMLDEVYLNEFRHRAANYNSVVYLEKVSNNGAETVAAMRETGEKFDLFVVGRGLGMLSPLKAGLDDWSECPELGSIGDLLVNSDFSSTASVLVVQQYSGMHPGRDGSSTPDSSNDYKLSHDSFEPIMRGK